MLPGRIGSLPRIARVSLAAVLVSAVLLSTITGRSHAAWPHDPNNGNVPICATTGDQDYPTICSDGAGGAIITWYDYRSGNYDIYAQRVNAAGVAQWIANGVAVCTAAGIQVYPTICSDGAGGAIITWYDYRGGLADIYAQRVNAAGAPQWTANGVAICTAVNDQSSPVIVADGASGAIITWTDARSGPTDIYAQRVNSAGVPQWTVNGVAMCTASNTQQSPSITSDGAGGAIVVWSDLRNGSNYDIYVQRVNSGGTPQWTANGVAICTAANNQDYPTIVPDGSGGAIMTWEDLRGGSYDVYAQRVNAAGTILWLGDGNAISTAANGQSLPVITSDGAGGAIIAWQDNRVSLSDIYAQRVSPAGATQWTADGVPLSTATDNQQTPTITSDGAGGSIIAWNDGRNGAYDVYAQRISATGNTLWAYNGAAISTAYGYQLYPTITTDGAGGAILTWLDARNAVDYDIYAQRIERYGYLGDPGPSIISVKDVPFDQGGEVKVGWNPSYLDADPVAGIYEYRIWRSAPPNAASARAILARGVTSDPDDAARSGRFLSLPSSATTYLWELVGRQQAYELSGYSIVTATTSDSVGAGNPRTAFMLEAGTSTYPSSPHWFSAPDSGYSVDNLPPSIPAPFTAAYVSGATHLHWGENTENDLAGYRLYRGSSSGFTPGPGNLISAQPDTGYNDAGAAGSWYKLSAIDAHGNESPYAVLGPNGTLDTDAGVALLALARPSPSPASRTSVMHFSLPRAESARLAIYDPSGRRVRVLIEGPLNAGVHEATFDLIDDAGRRVPAGLYFVRLETPGRCLSARLVALP
ncbi:MAG TPA: hypothetical protein VL123_06500 [Candidatus Udaeobacter sp.]|jgi:hypothetical protein|nr:hypothetical protein [Candidatus Udaeobacter sp.]